jgi:VWFA-related protein
MASPLRRLYFPVFFGVALLAASAAQNTQEISTSDAEPTFQTKVNLVTVPVVVRGRDGKAVGNLTKDDFLVFDKGKPQVVSKFSIDKPGTPVAIQEEASADTRSANLAASASNAERPVIASRFLVYLFDDLHLDFPNLSQARAAAEKHIATLDPATRIAVYTTSGLIGEDFTDDRAKLSAAMLRLQPRSKAGTRVTECPYVGYYQADRIQYANDDQALTAATLNAVACGQDPASAPQAAKMAAMRALNIGEMETRTTLQVLGNIVRRTAAMPGERSIILISPGFFSLREHPEMSDVIDRAIRNNVTISGLNARGLAPEGVYDASRPSVDPQARIIEQGFERDEQMAESDTLAEFAEATGGSYFHDNNDLNAGLERVTARPEFVYILGFAPQNLKSDGSFHAVKVSLKTPAGLKLQARRGYYAPKPGVDAADEAKQQIEDALFSREEMHDIPLSIHTQFFKPDEQNASLSVLARMDVRRIHFRKADGRNRNDVTVVAGLFDRSGNFIKASEKRLEFRLKDETLSKGLAPSVAVKTTFDVRPGAYVIRLVVRDDEGHMMSAANSSIEIP